MGHLRAGLAALAPHIEPSPAAWLRALDECAHGPNGSQFVTACCIVVEPETGTLRYGSAGHPPMLIVSTDGTTRWLDEALTPPAGVAAPDERPDAPAQLAAGDIVLLYSDGLVERRGASLSEGLERLERVASELVVAGSDDLTAEIVRRMEEGSPTDDDLVLVTVLYRSA